MKDYLDEALTEYAASDLYPFHMPGHKRQRLGDFVPEEIDITEVEGFDDLHHAEGILLEGQERLARVFGADESFYLVNGSTAGILAAVCGCVKRGGRILIARNCHLSVYHAAYLMEATPEYLYPDPTAFELSGSIAPAQAEEALRRFPDTQAVVITSPTCDGVVSDIPAIADLVHERDIPLIVDGAHGAHFGFAESFPQKSIAQGADLCTESLHKTLPAYTQSAALHLMRTAGPGKEYLFPAERVGRYLDIFQSSSPSYILMAGIDRCVRMIEEDLALYQSPLTRADSRFGRFEERLRRFYRQCEGLQAVRVFPASPTFARDPSKILIFAEAAGLHGQQLYSLLLDRYHLQMEMAAGSYVIALTSIMDTEDGFARLIGALREIDRTAGASFGQQPPTPAPDTSILYGPKEKRLEPAQAMDAESVPVSLSGAAGRISAEFVYLYPPEIPILVPGETLTEELAEQLMRCRDCGMKIRGMRDPDGQTIRTVV